MTDRHVDPERAQFDAFKELPRDTVIHMLNLVRFKDKATYPAEHALAGANLSGAEAYANYGRDSGAVFERLIAFSWCVVRWVHSSKAGRSEQRSRSATFFPPRKKSSGARPAVTRAGRP